MAHLIMGNFDIDLNFGLIHEDKVREIFEGKGSIEVKTERDTWAKTGNMEINHQVLLLLTLNGGVIYLQ